MIEHLKNLTDGILNRKITGGDLFNVHPEIYRVLQELSPDQFEESIRAEFTLARASFERLSKPNRHETTTGEKVYNAAKRLRPVLDYYLGPVPMAPDTTTHFTITKVAGDSVMGDKIDIGRDVTNSAVGSNASLKARTIVTQIRKSGLDAELKQFFVEAAETLANLTISEGDKEDASDDLAKLMAEVEKPTKDEGRIRRIWNRIEEIAPPVASVLASAVSIAKLVGDAP